MKTAVHQYEDKLLEFAYGELPRQEAEAIESHVRNCGKCSEALTQIRTVRSTMGHLPMEAAPAAGLESLLAYAEQTARRNTVKKPHHAWWRRLVLMTASAAALLVVGVVSWRANDEFKPDPVKLALDLERERAAPTQKAADSPPALAPVAAAQPAEQPRTKDAFKEEPAQNDEAQNKAEARARNGLVDDAAAKEQAAQPAAPQAAPGDINAAFGQEQGAGRAGGELKNRKTAEVQESDTNERLAKRAGPPVKQAPEYKAGTKTVAKPDPKAPPAPRQNAPASDDSKKLDEVDADRGGAGYDPRGSMARREAQEKEKGKAPVMDKRLEEKAADTQVADWSNSGAAVQRAGLRNDGTSVTQAAEGNAMGKRANLGEGGPALGLSTGSTGTGSPGMVGAKGQESERQMREPEGVREPAGAQTFETRKKDEPVVDAPKAAPSKKKAPARPAQEEPVAQQAPTTASAPAAVPPPPAPTATVSSPPQRSSMNVSMGTKREPRSAPRGGSAQVAEDELVTQTESVSDKLGATRDAEYDRRRRTQELKAKLDSARAASNAGDHLAEVKLCLEVLNSGADGYERVEALKRACDAFEALGEPDRAQPYCDVLVKEFPTTAAARLVVDRRRKAMSPSPAPKASKSRSEFSDEAMEKKEPAKPAEPADSPKPANAY